MTISNKQRKITFFGRLLFFSDNHLRLNIDEYSLRRIFNNQLDEVEQNIVICQWRADQKSICQGKVIKEVVKELSRRRRNQSRMYIVQAEMKSYFESLSKKLDAMNSNQEKSHE